METAQGTGRRPARLVRVVVGPAGGTSRPRVTLRPGDQLIVTNQSGQRLRVAPLDFFGSPFYRFELRPDEETPAMTVSGLWFQVDLRMESESARPVDVYLAPNVTV